MSWLLLPRPWQLLSMCLGLLAACSAELPAGPASALGGAGADGGRAVTDGSSGVGSGSLAAHATPLLRLTRVELDRALLVWLEDDSQPASRLLTEEPFTPFDRDHASQQPSAALAESMQALAEDVAARLTADAERFERVVGCAPDAQAARSCFDDFIAATGTRVLRRPLESADEAMAATLWDLAAEAPASLGSQLGVAVGLCIEAWLQDPEVLYRLEHGAGKAAQQDEFALSAEEIAARLSFWLVGLPPDEELLEAARAGSLATSEGRARQARRLLDGEAARTHWNRYHAMWLGYRALPHPPALTTELRRETEALIDRVLFDSPGSYFDLFTFDETYLSTELAEHYGLPAPDGEASWVTYPADSGRRGLLAHGSVLSAFSKFSDTSPTQRGILVRERLMCWPPEPPPPVVDVDQPPGEAGEEGCKEDRYRAHAENAGCAVCHDQIDPIGFGLERFDMAGRARETDDGNPDCAITGVGTLPSLGEFSGPAELSTLLLDSGELSDCAPRYVLQYLWGRQLKDGDEALVGELGDAFAAQQYRFADWLVAMVEQPRFTRRYLGEEP